MSKDRLGVAVIGAGMAGRSHIAGYANAGAIEGPEIPPVDLVAIADVNAELGERTARRFGYARAETSWEAVAAADDVDVVSVVVANHLHRPIVEGLLAAGKHVLCEKPMAPTIADAEAMVGAADAASTETAVGFTFRRSPSISAVRDLLGEKGIGRALHFNGHYWCDYGADPNGPMSWRYKGPAGSGALADIGSHLVDLAEFFCGPTTGVQGTTMATLVPDRPRALGVAVGHAGGLQVSAERVPVENEDVCTFTTSYSSGAVGTFSLSRVAFGHANTLRIDLFCENGTASFDLTRPAEFTITDPGPATPVNGARTVFIGPWHPYVGQGLPMDFPTVGHGQNDFFVYQARAFLDQIAGAVTLPPCPDMAHGLHNLRVLDAVVSATDKPVQL